MATIVNARDVLLQAASSRVAGVTMSNLTVDASQVTGLGTILEGVARVTMQASSQVFQIPKSGSVTPASIIFAVTVTGFSATPTLTVTSGTITPAPTLVGGSVTIPYANFMTDSVTLRASATDPETSTVYYDEITVIKVREGIDSLNGLLTNENHTLAADSLGNVLTYSGCSGNFKVYQGAVDVTNLCTYSMIANPQGLTQSINATTGAYSVTAGYPTGTDVATITYRATFGSTSIDKVFTVAKSKAGLAGPRGSRTFYVTLTGSTNTFSDSLATTTASVDGGPIRNDLVTQANDSMGFSQSKFWDGSAWQIVNAIVDGNLIVTGTIGAGKLSANSVSTDNLVAQTITTDKLLVTGKGQTLNLDPDTQDTRAWSGGTFSLVVDGAAPNGRALQITSSGATTGESRYYALDKNKNYVIRINAKQLGTATCYLGVDFCDINGASIAANTAGALGWPGQGTYFYFGLVNQAPAATYTEYSISFGPSETAKIPSNAVGMRLILLGNYNTSGVQRFSRMMIVEKTTGALVVDGTITAPKIDTKNLTIKDASGNVIFGVGSSVDVSSYMAASFGTNYVYNPDFANKQDGWTYSGGAIGESSHGFDLAGWTPNGGHAFWTSQSGSAGNANAYYEWVSNKIPVESGQRYITSAYTGAHRCKVAVFVYVYNASDVAIDNSYGSGDTENNQEESGGGLGLDDWKRCYNYMTIPAGAAYVRVVLRKYDTAAGQPNSYLFATNVQFERSTPSATKPGPYVSTGYIDQTSVRSGTPITSSNVSTYIGTAAIDSQYINKLQTNNYAEDGSGNPTAGVRVSSTGTALKVASGSLQIGSVFFTDYWYRLINGIDGSVSATSVIWRGNNDASTRSGAPLISCLSIQADGSTVTNSNTQHVTHRFKITPTSYTNRTDNLDAMTQIHVQFFRSTTASAPFDEAYFHCPSRTYDGVNGIAQGHWYKQWRYSGGNNVDATSQPLETSGLYTGYLRVRYANTYGWSATQDFGPNSTRLADLPTTTITGVGGTSASGGGAVGGFCPAPWVKIRLISGKEVPASQLYNGAVVQAVDDDTLEPIPKGGVVADVLTIWKPRFRVKLTNGEATEWSAKHRFATVNRGWVEVEQLLPGDHIIGQDECIVESVMYVGEGQVVSFQVKGAGTYFGGGMLCHNLKSQLP